MEINPYMSKPGIKPSDLHVNSEGTHESNTVSEVTVDHHGKCKIIILNFLRRRLWIDRNAGTRHCPCVLMISY